MTDFYVGQKVVCVDATWGSATGSRHQVQYCPSLPVEGNVYTIRSIDSVVAVYNRPASLFLRLVEVVNPIRVKNEPYFEGFKYRPLEEKSTDISIFKEILNNPHKQLEEA